MDESWWRGEVPVVRPAQANGKSGEDPDRENLAPSHHTLWPRFHPTKPETLTETALGSSEPTEQPQTDSRPSMAPKKSLLDLIKALPTTQEWGPPVTTETMLDGVPYAPFSKGDKLGRMADWTEGKDRDRGGRQQYSNRNYRGKLLPLILLT